MGWKPIPHSPSPAASTICHGERQKLRPASNALPQNLDSLGLSLQGSAATRWLGMKSFLAGLSKTPRVRLVRDARGNSEVTGHQEGNFGQWLNPSYLEKRPDFTPVSGLGKLIRLMIL